MDAIDRHGRRHAPWWRGLRLADDDDRLSSNLAAGLGFGGAELFEEIAKRGAMAVTGVFFMFTGNTMPKTLTPLSAAQCGDPVRAQAFQRFVGWV